MLIQHLDAETDALLSGECIHVPANGIYLTGDFFCRTVLCALEDHVLDEMRDTIPGEVFVARTGLQPNPDGNGTNMLHLFGDDGQAVWQCRALNVAIFIHAVFCLLILTHRTSLR